MIIFIRNIPANTLPREITDFVCSELKGEPFFSSELVLNAEIFALQNKDTQAFEFHGLVHIKPMAEGGEEAIKKLTEKRFKKSVAMLRDYNHRIWGNERRNNYNQLVNVSFNKRSAERRRGRYLRNNENMQTITSSISSSVYVMPAS